MNLSCPACGAVTSVPDDRLPPEGARARCHACGGLSVYYRGGLVADDPTPERGTPMPAPPGAAAAVYSGVAAPSIPLAYRTPPAAPAPEAADAPAALGPPVSIGWQIRTARGDQGPLPIDALKPMIRDGRLGPDDLACPPGRSEWIRAADVPDLQRWFVLVQKTGSAKTAAAAVPDVAPCTLHPGARGRWLCAACGNLACDACVLSEEMARVPVKLCPKCRRACHEFVPTRKITPFWEEIPVLLRYPIANGGWIAILICTLVGTAAMIAGASPIMGRSSRLFLSLCVLAYHLVIIRTTCSGARSIPHLGNINDIWGDMVWPGVRAGFVSLVVFLPAVLASAFWLVPAEFRVAVAEGMAEVAKETRIEWEKWKVEEASRPPEEQASWSDESGDGGDSAGGSSFDPSELLAGLPVHPAGAMAAVDSESGDGPGGGDSEDWTWFDDDTDYAALEREAEANAAKARTSRTTARLGWALAVIFSLAIWPVFLIVVALFNTVVPAFQPQIMLKLISEIPREYAWCAGITSACWIAVFLLGLPLSDVPVFNSWRASPFTYYFTFIAFHVMGRTAELAERKLDWH